jgi:multiple sugar transport system substrate-binding protein
LRRISISWSAPLVFGILLSACGTRSPVPTTTTPTPTAPEAIQIRWFIGFGTGDDPAQRNAETAVINDFNNSQNRIKLIQEVVPRDSAKEKLAAEIAAGKGPDLVGPISWAESNAFHDQYLDIAPLIKSSGFDTSVFHSELPKIYETSKTTVGLPFAIYPSAVFYNTALFDVAGLRYPPANYGDQYTLPDGSRVNWTWDTLTQVAKLLTLDAVGKNATQDGFDKTNIQQYGFTWQNENQPSYWGSYWAGGSYLADDGKTAQVPDAWKAAWKWTYESIWGNTPFAGSLALEAGSRFGSGNPFHSNKVAMAIDTIQYACCLNDLKTWDIGILPMYNDKVSSHLGEITFRIWKGTKHPEEAFQVLAYLVTTGVQKLIIGSKELPAAYDAVPALTDSAQAWITKKKAAFPKVNNWATIIAGSYYPDVPSAEIYLPNFNAAWSRGLTFANFLRSQSGLDIEKEIQTFTADLNSIFAK